MISNYAKIFHKAVKTPGVNDSFSISNYSHSDLVNNAIRNYENHSSVKKMRETITITSVFHFSGVDKADVEKSLGNLNSSKVGTFKNIPTKCLKVTSGICNLFLILNKNIPTKIKVCRHNTSVQERGLDKREKL